MKHVMTIYRVSIKQTPSEDDRNGLFTVELRGSLSDALELANEWLGNTPVSVKPYSNGLMMTVTERDRVEHADGGVDYIHITLHEVDVDPKTIKQVYETQTITF